MYVTVYGLQTKVIHLVHLRQIMGGVPALPERCTVINIKEFRYHAHQWRGIKQTRAQTVSGLLLAVDAQQLHQILHLRPPQKLLGGGCLRRRRVQLEGEASKHYLLSAEGRLCGEITVGGGEHGGGQLQEGDCSRLGNGRGGKGAVGGGWKGTVVNVVLML